MGGSVSGSDGKDRLMGGLGDDALDGGADDDALRMGPGRDRADAGEGDDRIGVRAGKQRTLRVPVSAKGRAAVRRARRLNVRLNVAVSAGGRRRATSTRFSLRVAL
jgi:hypothetical protein